MSSPYREGSHPAGKTKCPRCNKPLPPLDVATCQDNCGTWVSAVVANIALVPEELAEDRLTRWWRVRAPCPVCAETMTVRGQGDGLFQGCTAHGYFLDADIIRHTGLARPGVIEEAQDYRTRQAEKRLAADRAAAERAAKAEAQRVADEQRRAAEAAAKERKAAERRAQEDKRIAEEKAAEHKREAEERALEQKRAAARRARAEKRAQRRQELYAAVARGETAMLVEAILKLEDRVLAIEREGYEDDEEPEIYEQSANDDDNDDDDDDDTNDEDEDDEGTT